MVEFEARIEVVVEANDEPSPKRGAELVNPKAWVTVGVEIWSSTSPLESNAVKGGSKVTVDVTDN